MATDGDRSGGTNLRDYLTVLKRHRWLLVAVTALVVASAVTYSLLQDKVYASDGRVLVAQEQSIFSTGESPADPDFAQTEIQLIESEAVRSLARAKLGSVPEVSAVQVGTTAILEVTTESTDPAVAAAATSAYMDAYFEFRRRQAADALVSTSRQIQATVDQLQAKIDDLSSQLRSISCPADGGCPARDALEQDRDALLTEQVPFRQRLAQLNIDASGINVGAVVTPASVPDEPVRPQPFRDGALALGLGLVLGVALALAFEYLDDSVRDVEDVERAIPGLPILALIPPAPKPKKRSGGDGRGIVSVSDPTSGSAEAYWRLRTSVHALGVDRPLRWLQVTSATESEGKTTTAANLGLVLSRTEERVIIVSWDLRRPRVHEHFGISNEVGLTSVLLGDTPLSQAVQLVASERHLWVLPAGPLPPNPSDLLSSARARDVLARLRAEPAIIVFDCPPVLPVADATMLAEQVDGTLIVARAGVTSRKRMARAIGAMRQAGAPVLGLVLHTTSADDDYGYGYRFEDGAVGASSPARPAAARSAGPTVKGGSARGGAEDGTRASLNGPVLRPARPLIQNADPPDASVPAAVEEPPPDGPAPSVPVRAPAPSPGTVAPKPRQPRKGRRKGRR